MKYSLFFKEQVGLDLLKPVLNFYQMLHQLNQALGIDRKDLIDLDKNLLAKAVRINWVAKDLQTSPIYKPMLVEANYTLNTGDTRYHALRFVPHINHVMCLMRANVAPDSSWVEVTSKQHLAQLLNMSEDDIIHNLPWEDETFEWLEFALPETEHHLHIESDRLQMMFDYLDSMPDDFKFTKEWFATPIWN